MNHTTRLSPRSKPDCEVLCSDLKLGTKVVLQHVITDDVIYGIVIGYPEDDSGCTIRRTDEHWNKLLLPALELDDFDYMVSDEM